MYIYKYLLPDRKHLHPYGDFRWKKSPHPNGPWINPGQTAESFVSVVSATSAASQQTALTVHGEGTVSLAAWPSCWSPLKGGLGPKKYPLYKMYTGLIPKGYHLKGTTIFLWNRGCWADEHPGIRSYTYWKMNILNPTNGDLVQVIFRISIEWFLVSMSIFRGVKDLEQWLMMMHRFLGKGTTSLKHCFCWIPCWFSLAIVNN